MLNKVLFGVISVVVTKCIIAERVWVAKAMKTTICITFLRRVCVKKALSCKTHKL